jgi:hypothetical protein
MTMANGLGLGVMWLERRAEPSRAILEGKDNDARQKESEADP